MADDTIPPIEEREEESENYDFSNLLKAGELLKYLNDLWEKGETITEEHKNEIAKMAAEYKDLLHQLEALVDENEVFKELADEILGIALQSTDQSDLNVTLHKSIKDELQKQVQYLFRIKELSSEDLANREKGIQLLTRNARVAVVSISSIGEEMDKLNSLEDILAFNGGKLDDQVRQIAEALDLDKLAGRMYKKGQFIPGGGRATEDTRIGGVLDKKSPAEGLQEVINKRKEILQNLKAEVKEAALHRGILENTVQEIDSMYSRYAAIANLIPVIGPKIAQTLTKINIAATDAAQVTYDTFQKTKDPIQSIKAGVDSLIKGLGRTTVIVGALAAGLLVTYGILNSINNIVRGISANTQLAADQSFKLYKNALQAQTLYSTQLSTLRDILSVQEALTAELGRYVSTDPQVLSQISDASKVFGYTTKQAGQLQLLFQELGADESFAGNLQVITGELARANKLAPGIITEDLIDNADLIAKAFAGYPKLAVKAAIEVRKLGYDLKQAGRTMDHLLDIEGSLTAQMEASVALGRMIDLNKARDLALSGDIAGMMREVSTQAGSYAQFSQMSVPQRMLLARSLGMEVSQLQRSLYIQENLSDLTDEQQQLAQKHLATLEGVENMSSGQLKAQLANIQATQRLGVIFDKIKNSLIKSILPVAEALLPVFEIAGSLLQVLIVPLKIITPILKFIGVILEGILQPLRWIGRLIDQGLEKIEDFFNGFKIGGDTVRETAVNVIGVVSLIGASLWALNKISFAGLIGKLKGIGKAITPKAAGTLISKVKDSVLGKKYGGGQFLPGGERAPAGGQRVGGLLNKVKDKVKNVLPQKPTGSIPEQVTQQATKASEPIKSKAGMGARTFLTNLAAGFKQMANSKVLKGIAATALAGPALLLFTPALPGLLVMAGVGAVAPLITAGFNAVSSGFTALGSNLGNIAKGAAGLAILGASIIPFTFAMKLLKGVEPKTILNTSLAVGVLGGVATLLGAAGPALLIGSIGIASLGVALIPFAYAMKIIKVDDIFKVAGGLALLGITAAGLGLLAPTILTGSAAIAVLSASLGLAGLLLKPLAGIFERAGKGMLEFGTGLQKTKENIGSISLNDFKTIVSGIDQVTAALDKLDLSKLNQLKGLKDVNVSTSIISQNQSSSKNILEELVTKDINRKQSLNTDLRESTTVNVVPRQAPIFDMSQPGAVSPSTEMQPFSAPNADNFNPARLEMLLNQLNRTLEVMMTRQPTVYLKFDDGTLRKIEGNIRNDL